MSTEVKKYSLQLRGRLLTIEKPLVMGILNATPDSFHTASRIQNTQDMLARAAAMLAEGADILDIGGQSTRPGAERISAEKEMDKVIPLISAVHEHFPDAVISVDTFYSAVAEKAVESGASIINDISGAGIDPEITDVASAMRVPYILSHIQGEPQSMQVRPEYINVTAELMKYFGEKIDELQSKGLHDLIIDPGFGFGKTADHNLQILKNLRLFTEFNFPVMIGLSRKKTIQSILYVDADNALNGTVVMNTIALMNGVSMIRVHDVRQAVEAVKIYAAMQAAGRQ